MGALVLDGIQVKRPRCREAAQQGYANSTELADYPVAKGVPFREAHHIVGEAVVEAIRQGKALEELALADLQKFSAVIGEDVYPILALQSCPDKRAAKGGVSPKQVAQAIADAKTGWFDLCGLVPSPRPSSTGRGRKTEPGLVPGFLYAKKRTTGSAKVHVGFSFSSFERNSLTVRGRFGSNTCRLVYVMYYSTECLIGIIVRCYAIYRHELSWRRRMNNEYS